MILVMFTHKCSQFTLDVRSHRVISLKVRGPTLPWTVCAFVRDTLDIRHLIRAYFQRRHFRSMPCKYVGLNFAPALRKMNQPLHNPCHVRALGPVARSLVCANRWLRGVKTYRFPWCLTLVSANHASRNPGLVNLARAPYTLECDLWLNVKINPRRYPRKVRVNWMKCLFRQVCYLTLSERYRKQVIFTQIARLSFL